MAMLDDLVPPRACKAPICPKRERGWEVLLAVQRHDELQ